MIQRAGRNRVCLPARRARHERHDPPQNPAPEGLPTTDRPDHEPPRLTQRVRSTPSSSLAQVALLREVAVVTKVHVQRTDVTAAV